MLSSGVFPALATIAEATWLQHPESSPASAPLRERAALSLARMPKLAGNRPPFAACSTSDTAFSSVVPDPAGVLALCGVGLQIVIRKADGFADQRKPGGARFLFW